MPSEITSPYDMTSHLTSQCKFGVTGTLPLPWQHAPAPLPELPTAAAPARHPLYPTPHSLRESPPPRNPYIPQAHKLRVGTTDDAAGHPARAERVPPRAEP